MRALISESTAALAAFAALTAAAFSDIRALEADPLADKLEAAAEICDAKAAEADPALEDSLAAAAISEFDEFVSDTSAAFCEINAAAALIVAELAELIAERFEISEESADI